MNSVMRLIDDAILILSYKGEYSYVTSFKKGSLMLNYAQEVCKDEDRRELMKKMVSIKDNGDKGFNLYFPEYTDFESGYQHSSEEITVLERLKELIEPFLELDTNSYFTQVQVLQKKISKSFTENPWSLLPNAMPDTRYSYTAQVDKIPVIFISDQVFYIADTPKNNIKNILGIEYVCAFSNKTVLTNRSCDFFST